MNRSPIIHISIAGAVLVIAIATVVGVSVLLGAKQQEAETLSQEIAAKQTETLRVAAAKAALPLLVEAENALAQHNLSTADIVAFLESLEKMGKTQGASVEVLSVTGGKGNPTERLVLSLKVTGSFDAVARTIGRIEYGPYDTQVMTLTLDNGVSEEGGGEKWTAAAVVSFGASAPTN
jgi:Tfp pilus assembly protein PilO